MDKKYIGITVIIIFVIAGIFFIKSKTGNVVRDPEIKEFTVKAFKFGYTPDIITVNKGDKVKIKIQNTDVPHGVRIPSLNLKNNSQIEFTADKTGEFDWYCAVYCGEGHMKMKGKLIVK
ncbi:MAG: cupredoxin domain-containing protein [Nanoarchaeota archaeon]|nr:cupredoxin domain-containing protein [Nanoarchaeota archaeon]